MDLFAPLNNIVLHQYIWSLALFLKVFLVNCFICVMKLMLYKRFMLFFVTVVTLIGCSTPTTRLNDLAKSHQFSRSVVNTHGFDHLVYTNNLSNAKSVLHVYLEGDGTPWKYRVVTMPDPTPRNPLALRLMAHETNASAYVGRPCYNGTSKAPGCDPTLWTSARYSAKVVRSMTAVIKQLISENDFSEVKLIGHSGGGALAMLIAPKVDQVSQVITIAGNLDTQAWTKHHGYSPLYTSLNPAEQPALPQRIKQWHLVGGQDAVVPPALVKGYVNEQENALGISITNFSHGCCWEGVWSSVVNSIRTSASGMLPGQRFKVPSQ